jgi:hypothetical protein
MELKVLQYDIMEEEVGTSTTMLLRLRKEVNKVVLEEMAFQLDLDLGSVHTGGGRRSRRLMN